ncbi:hypothetical protein H0H92_001632, partial [Tricholoma furcatifolium]
HEVTQAKAERQKPKWKKPQLKEYGIEKALPRLQKPDIEEDEEDDGDGDDDDDDNEMMED